MINFLKYTLHNIEQNCHEIDEKNVKLNVFYIANYENTCNLLHGLSNEPGHFLSVIPYPCVRSHCLKDWDFNDPYVVMLYWFSDLEEHKGFSSNQ